MKHILTYLLPFKKRMAIGFTIKVTGTLAELVLPMLLSYILETVITRQSVKQIIFFGVIMVFFGLVACVCNITANRMAAKVTSDFSKAMRKELFTKTMYLSAKDTDRFTIPSLESRITTDTYNVHNFIGMMQRMGVRAPILLIGGITVTLIMDKLLALVMIATLPVIFITVYSVSKRGVPLYVTVQKSVDKMVRIVREDIVGIRVIKALSKNAYENERFDSANNQLSRDERKAGIIMSSINPIMTLLMNSGIAAVVAVAAISVDKGISSSATVIAFMQYFTLISMAMMSLSRMFVMYTKCAASASRISEVITTPDTFFVENAVPVNSDAYIEFKNVSFSYLGKRKDLKDISFSIKKGERLGIIGATGSGKTTIIKLLLRFYETDSGEIIINGRPITCYSREELTSLFGVALQNDFIYADTIEENIKFGRDITDAEMKAATKTAQAYNFIHEADKGYGYSLSSKGTNVSGGQKQRLLISRALAGNPEILILDDSSSALDYKTDASLRKALDENLSSSTVITVAQRVSSVKNCDLILVLDEGQIIGKGRHEELLENCKEYKEISDSQMGGAFVE